ncbi:hypothetical protein D3C72_2071060 [compost metagenome]
MIASGVFWFTASSAEFATPCDRPTIRVGRSAKPKSAFPLATSRKASVDPVPLRIAVTSMPWSAKYPFSLATKNGA